MKRFSLFIVFISSFAVAERYDADVFVVHDVTTPTLTVEMDYPWASAVDAISDGYTAGDGLSLVGLQFSVDTTWDADFNSLAIGGVSAIDTSRNASFNNSIFGGSIRADGGVYSGVSTDVQISNSDNLDISGGNLEMGGVVRIDNAGAATLADATIDSVVIDANIIDGVEFYRAKGATGAIGYYTYDAAGTQALAFVGRSGDDGLLRLEDQSGTDAVSLHADAAGWTEQPLHVGATAGPSTAMFEVSGGSTEVESLNATGSVSNSAGNLDLNDNVDVTGNVDATGTLAVGGTSQFDGNVTIGDGPGNPKITYNNNGDDWDFIATSTGFSVINNTDINIVVTIDDDAPNASLVLGAAANEMGQNLDMNSNDITEVGALTVTGPTSNSAGNFDLNDNLDVTGNVDATGTLAVGGTSQLDDSITIGDGASTNKTYLSFNDSAQDYSVGIDVNGWFEIKNPAGLSPFVIRNDASDSLLALRNGSVAMNGDADFNLNNIYDIGNLTLGNNTAVAGNIRFNNDSDDYLISTNGTTDDFEIMNETEGLTAIAIGGGFADDAMTFDASGITVADTFNHDRIAGGVATVSEASLATITVATADFPTVRINYTNAATGTIDLPAGVDGEEITLVLVEDGGQTVQVGSSDMASGSNFILTDLRAHRFVYSTTDAGWWAY